LISKGIRVYHFQEDRRADGYNRNLLFFRLIVFIGDTSHE
jgi:hypothetical protein